MPFASPPVFLTFLAPAARCNQRCPACVIDQAEEPVQRFDLTPEDYGRFVEEFVEANVPVLSVAFQGYEVTLPESWPYVEAVFAVSAKHGLKRSFITNGMLLSKRADRIRALDPYRVSISLDGSDAATNDAIRGLDGAFAATDQSLRRFLLQAPELTDRVAIASTLFGETNYQSLLSMPAFLGELGVRRWGVSWELRREGERVTAADTSDRLFERLLRLKEAAETSGVRFHVSDDFERFQGAERTALKARHVYNLDFLYRLDPRGYVRTGRQLLDVWKPEHGRRWVPGETHAVEAVGYKDAAHPFLMRK